MGHPRRGKLAVTAAGVQFRVLGPLEIEAGGRVLELGGPRLRALLALLVIHAGRVVSLRALVDGLWGQHRPPDADRTIRAYMSRLRQRLSPAVTGTVGELIVTRAPGYLLRVDPEVVDAVRFERLAADGRRALEAAEPAAPLRRLPRRCGCGVARRTGEFPAVTATLQVGLRLATGRIVRRPKVDAGRRAAWRRSTCGAPVVLN